MKFAKKIFNHIVQTIVHFGWLSLIIIPILFMINWSYFAVNQAEKESLLNQQVSLANEKVNTIDFIISSAINTSHNDMQVMIDADEMQSYLSDSTELNLEGVEQLLLRIVSNKPQYSSIEFLNLSGQQVIWMNRIGGEIQFTESESLLSRSDEEYFNVANTLTNQELYILPIFFDNISGFSVPMTGLVMPVYDSNDDKQGYLVLNYNANFLLSIFDEYVNEQSEFIEIGILIDGDIWEVTDNFNNLLLNQSS